MPPVPTFTLTAGATVSYTGGSLLNPPINVVNPGQPIYTASAVFYEAYFPAPLAGTVFPFSPTGANYIPIVYVRNVDPVNQLLINWVNIGGVQSFNWQLSQNGFVLLFNPVTPRLGGGVGGIDAFVGLKVFNSSAATTGTCACEIFMAI